MRYLFAMGVGIVAAWIEVKIAIWFLSIQMVEEVFWIIPVEIGIIILLPGFLAAFIGVMWVTAKTYELLDVGS